jgi:hypothetical protein
MKSIAGFTGKPNTLHLTEVTKPTLDQTRMDAVC